MKNVLLSEIGNNVYIIEGSRRTDTAAKTAIDALCARGIISPDLAERAKGDRATLDKIKKNMESVMFETTGDKWNFYTKSGLYMSIPANCEKYILVESTERKPAAVPRKATKLYITFLCDTSAAKAGYKATVFKSENKWFYEDENGHTWNILPAMLHNHDVIRINGAEEATTGEETPEPVQTTTTTETEPQRATETPKKTIRTGERLYSHPHRHMVTVEGLQGELVKVIYRGRLYLVCSSDLYTDESETTPAMLPPQSTETAQKTTDMATFAQAYHEAYTALYDNCGEPETDERERYYCILFDANMDDLQPILAAFAAYRGDLVTSDRECSAFMIALETVGTPQNAPQGTESTTGEETPTDDTKTPHSATDGATDGTTPASDPRQPDGATTGDTDGWNRITYGATTTPPRTACENAPQRTETGEGGQTTTTHHKTPPRGKYKATHARPPKFGKVCAKIRVPSCALYFTGAG